MSDSRRETSLSLSGQNRPSVMEVVQVDDIPVLVARPDQAGASRWSKELSAVACTSKTLPEFPALWSPMVHRE